MQMNVTLPRLWKKDNILILNIFDHLKEETGRCVKLLWIGLTLKHKCCIKLSDVSIR